MVGRGRSLTDVVGIRSGEFKGVRYPAVDQARTTADRLEGSHVDAALVVEALIDMQGDHLPDDDRAAEGGVGDSDDLGDLTLELDGRFADPWWFDQAAGGRGQPGDGEFGVIRAQGGRAEVDGFDEGFGGHVDDEFASGFDVDEGVFFAAIGPAHRGKGDGQRVGANGVEEAEGGQIGDAGSADGRHPGDRPGHDGADQEFVGVLGTDGRRVQVHGRPPWCR